MNKSLRSTLIVWLSTPLLLAAGLLLLENYYNARRSANNAYDNALYASALAIADRVVLNGTALEVDLPYIAFEMLSAAGEDHVYYKVVSGDDIFITGYKDLPDIAAGADRSRAGDALFFDAKFRGQTVRTTELRRTIHRQSRDFDFTVAVAKTVGERDALSRELTLTYGSRFMLLVAIVIGAAWIGASRALRPVEQLRRALAQRSYHDLTPVDVPVPSEIQVVVSAINQLMERLRKSFSEISAFVDDASHQLRTPIASLRTQIEVALGERDADNVRQSLQDLLVTTTRTGRLAEQLLAHARTMHAQDYAPTDLGMLVENVTRAWVLRAVEADIDLGLERGPASVRCKCSAALVEEALNNLIHNAIQYCPAGSAVTVRLRETDAAAVIEVEDNGPGIPAAARDDALKRFRRFDQEHTSGCGLGLAIAKDIAELHHGTLSLHDGAGGRGLLARFTIPLG